ncbi:MAG: ubiquinol-cytochrome c reductase iron-sulfur subunit [Candidatus Caenarcaniphilales bacterium]|jgi:Rieske Fe-S protein|nr:ubiquinol-cytochrome c reductase iron-sulfur subunit [Candidatus Caenarcaniphilales bacterium]
MSNKLDRRDFIKAILAVPVIGGFASLFISPFIRYLKPSSGPLATAEIFKRPDKPSPVQEIRFAISDFPEPWSFKYFMFQETNREYTSVGEQIKTIPGAIVKTLKAEGKEDFVVFSRVCPHLGCVFNFVPVEDEVAAGYNYKPQPGQKVFACPCHLSVYDPMLDDSKGRGKVVSGPAPRSPFKFNFEIEGSEIVIRSLESGGIS